MYDTFSYALNEYKLVNYNHNVGFEIKNPNIDTSFNTEDNNIIKIKFESESDY